MINIGSIVSKPFRFWLSKMRGEQDVFKRGLWFIVGFVPLCAFCSVCSLLLAPDRGTTPDRDTASVRPTRTIERTENSQPISSTTAVEEEEPTEEPTSTTARPSATTRPTEAAEPTEAVAPAIEEPTATNQPAPDVAPAATTAPVVLTATPAPSPTSAPTTPPAPRTVGAAVVTSITDGDTIHVDIDGVDYTVRYIGMDTPERGDPFYSEATNANSNLVLGKEVWLEKDVNETDRFGRLLRYVYVGDVMINEELVRTGYAQASAYPPDVKFQDRLDSAERVARENNTGLWAIAVVVPTEPPAAPTSAPVATTAPAPVPPTEAPPPPAPTGSGLVIIFVNKGDEYVDIRNDSGGPIDLGGWTLRSERGSQDCALGGVIGAGEVLRIWAMSGSPGFVCGFGSNIWNNSDNDDALLINPQGQEAYRYDS